MPRWSGGYAHAEVGMMYDEICGLPKVIVVLDLTPMRGGAMCPGDDLSIVAVDTTSKAMELMMFHTPAPIHGLLMWERERQRISFDGNASFPPPRQVNLFFFGYKCGKCKEVYLLSDSVK